MQYIMVIILVTDHFMSLCFTASAKIGLQGCTCRVCLEEDGTTIDEDEVLAELKGQNLLILTEVQQWSPALMSSEVTAAQQAQLTAPQAPQLPSDATDDELNSSSQSVQEDRMTDYSSSSGVLVTRENPYACGNGKCYQVTAVSAVSFMSCMPESKFIHNMNK